MIAICGGVAEIRRRILLCPTEGRRRRMVVVVPSSPWYGDTTWCLGCGDSWCEGERGYRPFRRGWRTEAKAKARRYWQTAWRMTDAERRQWLSDALAPVDERPVATVDTNGLT